MQIPEYWIREVESVMDNFVTRSLAGGRRKYVLAGLGKIIRSMGGSDSARLFRGDPKRAP